MTRSTTRIALPLTSLLLLGLTVAGPASAIYVMTPLQLHPSDREADVGDTLTFTIEPQNETERAAWAGETLSVRYAFDAAEGEERSDDPDAPVDSSSMQDRELLAALTLDDAARATFEWVVPEEVDARNVDVKLVSADGEAVGFTHVAIGDAPPQMRMMAGSGPAPEPYTEAGDGGGASSDSSDGARNDTPAVGAVAVLGVGAVALALRRK